MGIDVKYRCIIVEDQKRCENGFLLPAITARRGQLGASRFICDKHLDAGYCWLHSLLQDTSLTIDDVLKELPKHRDASTLALQRGKETPVAKLLRGYGLVQLVMSKVGGLEIVEDAIMLDLNFAKDPKAPIVRHEKSSRFLVAKENDLSA